MGKPITNFEDLPDIPDALAMDGLAAPTQEPAAQKAAAPKPAAPAADGQKEYAPSEYVVKALDKLPKEDIKKKIGLDIDNLIANTKSYGVLEALAAGEFTPVPVPVFAKGIRSMATVRLYTLEREPKWDCEVHNVQMRYATNEQGQPYKDARGNWATEYYKNPLQPGEVLYYSNAPLSPEQMDHLRLTGHLGEPMRGINAKGEEISTLVSVDPWNNHQLCRTNSKAVKFRLLPAIFTKDDKGNELIVRTNGCTRIDKDGVVMADLSITERNGFPVKVAHNGTNTVKVPVNAPTTITLDSGATINLSKAQVGRLSPSVTNKVGEDRVVTYLNAKQLGELSLGHGIWVGDKGSMSVIMSGPKDNPTISPVTDNKHSTHIQYDVFGAKLKKTVNFDYALKNELQQQEKAGLERAAAQTESVANTLSVGNHV